MAGLDDLHDAAIALTLGAPPSSRRLDSTGAIHPAIRTFDPLVELTDTMRALRQRAWELLATPSCEIAPLQRFAALSLAVHARAAQFYSGTDLPVPSGDRQHVVDVLMHRAAAWRDLAARLYPVRSIDPRDSLGGKEIGRAATLLAQCADLHNTPAPGGHVTVRQQRTKQAVNGALSLVGDITAWNARTFGILARSNQLFLPARELSRDEISQNSAAATARLTNGYVPLAARQIAQIADTYKALASGNGTPTPVPLGQDLTHLGAHSTRHDQHPHLTPVVPREAI